MGRPRQFRIRTGMTAIAIAGVAFAGIVLLGELWEPIRYIAGRVDPGVWFSLFLIIMPIVVFVGPFLLVALGLGIGQILFPIRPDPTIAKKSSSAGLHDL
jgi:hypothetical protein